MFKYLLLLAIFFTLLPAISHALTVEDVYGHLAKKQSAKKDVRWSLSSWLATKKKMSLMDQWLQINTEKNNFEIMIDASFSSYNITPGLDKTYDRQTTVQSSSKYKMSFFLYVAGLEYNYDISDEEHTETAGILHLRLLGPNLQSTYLGIFYGSRKYSDSTAGDFQQSFYGAIGTLYFFDFFGTEVMYRQYSSAESKTYKIDSGERIEFTAFLELNALRLTYTIFNDVQKMNHLTSNDFLKITREGSILGLKLFF